MLKLHEPNQEISVKNICNVSSHGFKLPVIVRVYYRKTNMPFLVQNENSFVGAKDKGRAKHFHNLKEAYAFMEKLESKFDNDWWFEIVSMNAI